MKQFPPNAQFRHEWRSYQKRVINELRTHFSDNHLHVIAPPGAGKTVLGLEVCLQLNKPTLVVVPSISLQSQWIQSFVSDFLLETTVPAWISDDIRNASFFTVTTYQALYSLYSVDQNKKGNDWRIVMDSFKKRGLGTLVLDESHHLKNKWVQSLYAFKRELNPKVIALSATPPYDANFTEWSRYIGINGEIDAEISVPELIQNNHLCPHQDFIYFSQPTQSEQDVLDEYWLQRDFTYDRILTDDIFRKTIQSQPFILEPDNNLEWIYTHFDTYLSLLSYLSEIQAFISERHIELLEIDAEMIPVLDYEILEQVLEFYLFQEDALGVSLEHRNKLLKSLKKQNLFNAGKLQFSNSELMSKMIRSSMSKLGSIQKIVDFEYKQLGADLRLVILTDYIRKEFLSEGKTNGHELNKMGVIPIFEKLRRGNLLDIKLCVLTGSIVIIPMTSLTQFNELVSQYELQEYNCQPLSYDANYVRVKINESLNQNIVNIITQLFETGQVELIIGTKALLGEGWNAPSINTLILASFVGSFVSSNQMRGRAIRTDVNNKSKTGNIWHLACVDSSRPNGGRDIELLERRFRCFVGVSRCADQFFIENGLNRLDVEVSDAFEYDVFELNKSMLESASKRDQLKSRWSHALQEGAVLVKKMNIPRQYEKPFVDLKRSASLRLTIDALGSVSFVTASVLSLAYLGVSYIPILLSVAGLSGFLFKGSGSWIQFLNYKNIDKKFQKIGEVLVDCLVYDNHLRTDRNELKVISNVDSMGNIQCWLEGSTNYENAIFSEVFMDLFENIDNPRYLLRTRKNKFQTVDRYYAIPNILSKNKDSVQLFQNLWNQNVERCTAIYTRSKSGRRELLKARVQDRVILSNKAAYPKKVWT